MGGPWIGDKDDKEPKYGQPSYKHDRQKDMCIRSSGVAPLRTGTLLVLLCQIVEGMVIYHD